MRMLERFFRLEENGTTVARELAAGVVTFMTPACIIAGLFLVKYLVPGTRL